MTKPDYTTKDDPPRKRMGGLALAVMMMVQLAVVTAAFAFSAPHPVFTKAPGSGQHYLGGPVYTTPQREDSAPDDIYYADNAHSDEYFADDAHTVQYDITGHTQHDIIAAFLGQSGYRRTIDLGGGGPAFIAEAQALGYTNVTVINGSKDSAAIDFRADNGAGAQLNSDNTGRGNVYMGIMLPAVNAQHIPLADVTHLYTWDGETDRVAIQTGILTEADEKAAFGTWITLLKTDFPNAKIFHTLGPGNNAVSTSFANNATTAQFRSQWQYINEDVTGRLHQSFGVSDLTRADSQHLDGAGSVLIMQRNARLTAYTDGVGAPVNPRGSHIASAVYNDAGDYINVTVSHDAGTDFTLSENNGFWWYKNGVRQTDFTTAARLDATHFRLSGGASIASNDTVTMLWPGGTSQDLTLGNIFADNALYPQTLQPIFDLTVTEDNDLTPVGLAFTDIVGGALSTQYTSDATVTSFAGPLAATVASGPAEIRKNSTGSWGSTVNVSSGDTINLRMTSSSANATALSSLITLGSGSTTWSVTTLSGDGAQLLFVLGTTNQTVYEYTASTGWNMATAAYDTISKSIAGDETVPHALEFKPDGTRMYVAGSTGDDVNMYSLGTPWDITSAGASTTFSVGSQETALRALAFKADGRKMYVSGTSGADINQYTLATPWDVTSATFNSPPFSTAPEGTNLTSLTFKPDGLQMYTCDSSVGADKVFQYTLSSAWDVTSAALLGSFDIVGQDTNCGDIKFKDDGTKLYMIGNTGDAIYQYTVATPWTVSTASYDSVSLSVNAQEPVPTAFYMQLPGSPATDITPTGLAFTDVTDADLSTQYTANATVSAFDGPLTATVNSGTAEIRANGAGVWGSSVAVSSGDTINARNTSSALNATAVSSPITLGSVTDTWSITTLAGADTTPAGLSFTDVTGAAQSTQYTADATVTSFDGSLLAQVTSGTAEIRKNSTGSWGSSVSVSSGDTINARNTSSASIGTTVSSVIELGTGSDTWSITTANPVSNQKLLVIGDSNDTIYQYSITTPWSMAAGSYDSVSKSITGDETVPHDLDFKSDGTRMYVFGSTGDDVNMYTLGTPWDITTAGASTTFSIAGQEIAGRAIAFKTDGTKMYIMGTSGVDINQYTLSSAWDVTSATFNSPPFSVSAQGINPAGLTFKSDGLQMFTCDANSDNVNEYTLSSAWDVTSASITHTHSISSEEANCSDILLKDDGTKMYILGTTGDDVTQYSLSTPWDVSTMVSDAVSFSVGSQDGTPTGMFFHTY